MIPITASFYQHLQEEIIRLQADYTATLERLKVAREQGDLSENGAYRYAKMELGNLSRQLRELHQVFNQAHIQEKTQTDCIAFGSIVELSTNQKRVTYTLVSQFESDPRHYKISMESPLGRALVHKRVGDIVLFHAPAGIITYTITAVH
ncbi:transcription elongation factor GreA [Candidatus Cerribacteria bacterium 'Amazon FNV 2010 28 9']|uniref:Transcription elongation factor GreA n=1 Tax=Candidatus Cerribacteria bacterium 'Amazon FNV 2010 28 9' TaxID=2081795 RepID=A0A317JU22_9BACT|nr:MAG: transcription elongation factor GreA [Candidatus Cerribacteria bacterium 'Amazon FNV 2010 28 9']